MPRRNRTASAAGLAMVLCALAVPAAFGMFAMPSPAPVDRLIRNIEAYIQSHPKDAQGYYSLGRVHFLAWSLKSAEVGTYGEGDANKLPAIADMQPGRGRPRPNQPAPEAPKPPTVEELAQHVAGAITNFRKAIALEPKNPLFHQGLGSILEQGGPAAPRIPGGSGLPPGDPSGDKDKAPDTPLAAEAAAAEAASQVKQLGDKDFKVREAADKALRAKGFAAVPALAAACREANDPEVRNRAEAIVTSYWKGQAVESYYTAYSLAIAKDLEIRNRPIRGLLSLVSYESGRRYVALVTERGPTEAEKEKVAKIQKDLATLDAKPMGPITPIVFSLDGPRPLNDLLAAGPGVKFDLDGTGRGFTWPWVKADTGILVWDPQGKGRITSGHQLFGSVTWNIFWTDGYRALDALDDNRDGELAGEELKGLAVWHDRNGNGASEEGEVAPIEAAGILSLRTRPTGVAAGSPFASDGLRTLGGTVLPTYDWTTRPIGK